MKCQFDCTTNIQRAEYGDKSPSSSLVNIYSTVATFSQTSAGVIQTLYAYSAPVHSHIRMCTGMLVDGQVKTNHNHISKYQQKTMQSPGRSVGLARTDTNSLLIQLDLEDDLCVAKPTLLPGLCLSNLGCLLMEYLARL